jgi:predicted nuclease of predicted toxin-antitoxin system
MDKDFGQFVFAEGAPHCGIVRLPDVPTSKRIELMKKVVADHSDDLAENAIITVRGGRIRISRVS